MNCPVCLEEYAVPVRGPQVLSCGHTFCSSCLEQVAHGGSFLCPTCRTATSASAVHPNFALRDALEARHGDRGTTPVVAAVAAPIEAEAIPEVTPEESEVRIQFCTAPAGEGAVGAAGVVDVLVSVIPPEGSMRTPCDICCVVDTSQSMDSPAMVQDEVGAYVQHGLTLLDIVKHALKTIIHTLGGRDRLAIVAYDDMATTILELTPMTAEGQRRAELRTHQLLARGNTNLWVGLETGVNLLSAGRQPGRLQHVLLLTDGIPNIQPPRGIVPMMRHLKERSGGKLGCTVSTFGFGYDLDSAMLVDVAALGGGSYAFIPDAGFVGTVFVNAVANLLVAMGSHPTLLVSAEGASPLTSAALTASGRISTKATGEGLVTELGCVQFGQTKDFLFKVPRAAGGQLRAELRYTLRDGVEETVSAQIALAELQPPSQGSKDQLCRLAFVEEVRKAMQMLALTALEKLRKVTVEDRLPGAQDHVEALAERVASLAEPSSEFAAGIIEDVSGQVSEAFSRAEWYTKWGVHFLPSLLRAHVSQQCNNFKDPGVQFYGGQLFRMLRDEADLIFLGLDAPRPQPRPPREPRLSQTPPRNAHGVIIAPPPRAAASSMPLVNMSAYYDRSSG